MNRKLKFKLFFCNCCNMSTITRIHQCCHYYNNYIGSTKRIVKADTTFSEYGVAIIDDTRDVSCCFCHISCKIKHFLRVG